MAEILGDQQSQPEETYTQFAARETRFFMGCLLLETVEIDIIAQVGAEMLVPAVGFAIASTWLNWRNCMRAFSYGKSTEIIERPTYRRNSVWTSEEAELLLIHNARRNFPVIDMQGFTLRS